MDIYNRALDSKLAWAGVVAVSAALIVGGIAGHSVTAIVIGSVVAGSFGAMKVHQVYTRRKHDRDPNPFIGPLKLLAIASHIANNGIEM